MSGAALNVLIVGAGGIGGYYGARLADAGHNLVLTARGRHLAAIQARGLEVMVEGETLHCRAPAVDHATLIRKHRTTDFDLVIFTIKSTATKQVLKELGSWLAQGDVPVLSLQNGVDNEVLIARRLGEARVLGGLAVRIGGHITEPGKVRAEGVAQVVVGGWPCMEQSHDCRRTVLSRLKKVFDAASIPTRVSDNIRYELWRKLVINNGVNPLSALTGLDTRSLTHHPDFSRIVHGMMAETVEASRADGVNLKSQDLDEMYELIRSFNAIKTSMLVDKEKGRPLELDSISGAVLNRCQKLGIDAPYTRLVSALLRVEGSQRL